MTRETFTASPLYTIATTGPYPITHPYQVDTEIKCTIFQGTTIVELGVADFSVAPSSSETTGDVTLDAAIAATYAGASLLIRRETVADQGWAGQTAREKGLEAQLDALTQRMQEIDEGLARAIKIPTGEVGELPLDYASTFLAFDATKALYPATGTAGVPTSAFMATVLDDLTAAAARTTLGAVGLTGTETIGGVKSFSSGITVALATGDASVSVASADANGQLTLKALSGAADEKAARLVTMPDGTLRLDLVDDAVATKNPVMSIARTGVNVDETAFYIDGAVAALIEAAGTSVTSNQALITKEKGDKRYLRGLQVSALNGSGYVSADDLSLIVIDTLSAAATDNAGGLSGGYEGQIITLSQANASRVVTLKHSVGGLGFRGFQLSGAVDFTFTSTSDTITFIKGSGWWLELSRSINA